MTESASTVNAQSPTSHDPTLPNSTGHQYVAEPLSARDSSEMTASKPPESEQTTTSLKAPRSSPLLQPVSAVPPLTDEIKRDSAFAPSLSTTEPTVNSRSHTPTPSAGGETHTPAILVQDSSAIGAETATKDAEGEHSLDGKQEDNLEELNLSDLASDRIAFSQRGSILYAGKKMNKRPDFSGDGLSRERAATQVPTSYEISAGAGASSMEAQATQKETAVEAPTAPAQTLTADPINGRVMSMEEMTISKRVRSMYEHGDERAADWSPKVPNTIDEHEQAESFTTANSTPEPSPNSLAVRKTRQPQSPSLHNIAEGNELAGGIEDWEDIVGDDVDRYGFIKPKRNFTRNSTGESVPSEGVQRVATQLRVQSDRPGRARGFRRMVSPAATSSRSLPLKDQGGRDVAPSLHSIQTHRSSSNTHTTNPFRSRDRKAVAEASDMLRLPPGLAQLEEQRQAGPSSSALKRREWARNEKWQKMATVRRQGKRSTGTGGGMQFEFDTKDSKLVSRTWKGIPDRWRATAWHSFLSTSAKKRGIGASDDELMAQFHELQERNSADDVQIDMDVPRTISMHIMFRRRYRGGQRLLFRVLHAISLYFPETGYVQGMASLAATLLCYFEEESAFVMMVRLWQLRGLEQLFESGFGGLMKALEQFEKDWLQHGDVGKKLDDLGVSSTAYGTRWYLTLFNMSIPFPAQLRVWDVFMLLGDDAASNSNGSGNAFGGADLDVLHATSAALIDATREILLDSDFENAMKVLTSFVPIKDEDLLMRVAKAEWKRRKKRAGRAV